MKRTPASADHVAAGLRKAFPKLRVESVTGLLTPEDRRAGVESMADDQQRILVATDCLSEGINLQHLFEVVVHYDLSWNPTRHQQREGRVDRFGQPTKVVRSVLLFSPDSAIDGAVLEVILRKADAIREATGVAVPLPEERSAVAGALMHAVLLRRGRSQQLMLDLGFNLAEDAARIETRWRDAEEGERRSRARFAQNTIRSEEVAPEWQRWRALLGGPDEVKRFLERAMSRLNAPLEEFSGSAIQAHLHALPLALRERLAARGFEGTRRIAFEEPGPTGAEVVVRSHPIAAILADYLLEGALHQGDSSVPPLGRIGVWPTTVAQSIGDEAFRILEAPASGNLASTARDRFLAQARERVQAALHNDGPIAKYCRERATALLQDHDRVRSALSQTGGVPRVTVEQVLPADIVGLFVLIPGGI
jgi:hypothetical protein